MAPRSWGRVARVMVSPLRHPKTGMLWFRQSVPKALQVQVGVILGRGKPVAELKWTLATHDPQEAKQRMPAAMTKANAILEAARNGPSPLTHRELHALAGLWYLRKLQEWEVDPAAADAWDNWDVAMPTDPYVEATENDENPVVSVQWRREWPRFLSTFAPTVSALLVAEGVVTDAASEAHLAELIVQRLPQALERHGKRQNGDYRPDPLPSTFPAWEPRQPDQRPPEPGQIAPASAQKVTPKEPAAVSLQGLLEGWKAVAVVKPRTVAEAEYAIKDLAKALGHDDAARVRREDLIRWRDQIKADGATNNTWNNRLSLVRQVLLHGMADGSLKMDPTEGLRLRKSRQISPPPYTDDEATRILLAARRETKPSLRWAHWVMAFTGMRAGEVLQLLGRDVRQEGDIWLIDVNEGDLTKSVKTGQRRHVPVHPALIREGFVAYAQTVGPDAPVFPDKKLDRFGNRGGRAWNVIGTWVRQKAGITDPAKAPDHSWRHRVEDELRAAEISEDVRDAITGHARRTMGRQYGIRGKR